MKRKLILWLLLLTIAPMCLAYWISPGYNQQHAEVAFPLCVVLPFAFSFSQLSTKQVCVVVVTGMMIGKIIKIVIDCIDDPTSHNLLPFELAIYGVLFSFFILIGAGAGKLFHVIKAIVDKRKRSD